MTSTENEEPPGSEPSSSDDEDLEYPPDLEPEEPLLPQPERRPPYAVAYSTDGGHLYEVLLPGDASAVAEDGVLKIQHAGAVLGIVRVQPVRTEEGDG